MRLLQIEEPEGGPTDPDAPGAAIGIGEWRALFEAARLRAERALIRPVTHAVVALRIAADTELSAMLSAAAAQAGLVLLRCLGPDELAAHTAPALTAAMLAEDLAPRPAPERR